MLPLRLAVLATCATVCAGQACEDVCPHGFLCDSTSGACPGQCSCVPCGPGTWSNVSGTPSVTSCSLCRAGTWSDAPALSKASLCTPCAAGRWSSDEGRTEACTACPSGTWGTTMGETSNDTCTSCPAGNFSFLPGSTACTACAVGAWSNTTGASVCEECAPGSWGAGRGQTACASCEAGTWNDATGATACTQCAAGKWSSALAASNESACSSCAAGYWSATEGADSESTCTACGIGRSSPVVAAASNTTCVPCSGGSFAPATASTVCTRCQPGTSSAAIGATSNATCTTCSGGSYGSTYGLTACTQCSAGSWSASTGATASSTCQLCAAGTWGAAAGATACDLCQPGWWNAQAGALACTPCEAGYWSPTQGAMNATACQRCPPGAYSATQGANASSACTLCELGKYNPIPGATECQSCASGSASATTGATSATACGSCENGTVAPTGSAVCTPCVFPALIKDQQCMQPVRSFSLSHATCDMHQSCMQETFYEEQNGVYNPIPADALRMRLCCGSDGHASCCDSQTRSAAVGGTMLTDFAIAVASPPGFWICCMIFAFVIIGVCVYFARDVPPLTVAILAPFPILMNIWIFVAIVVMILGLVPACLISWVCLVPARRVANMAGTGGMMSLFGTVRRTAARCCRGRMRGNTLNRAFNLIAKGAAVAFINQLKFIFGAQAVASYAPTLKIDWDLFTIKCPPVVRQVYEHVLVPVVSWVVEIGSLLPTTVGIEGAECPSSFLIWYACFICSFVGMLIIFVRLEITLRLTEFNRHVQASAPTLGIVELKEGEVSNPLTRVIRHGFRVSESIVAAIVTMMALVVPRGYIQLLNPDLLVDLFKEGCPAMLGIQASVMSLIALVSTLAVVALLACQLDHLIIPALPGQLLRFLRLPAEGKYMRPTFKECRRKFIRAPFVMIGLWPAHVDKAYEVRHNTWKFLDGDQAEPARKLSQVVPSLRRSSAVAMDWTLTEKTYDNVRVATSKPLEWMLYVLPYGILLGQIVNATNRAPLTSSVRDLRPTMLTIRVLRYFFMLSFAIFFAVKIVLLSNGNMMHLVTLVIIFDLSLVAITTLFEEGSDLLAQWVANTYLKQEDIKETVCDSLVTEYELSTREEAARTYEDLRPTLMVMIGHQIYSENKDVDAQAVIDVIQSVPHHPALRIAELQAPLFKLIEAVSSEPLTDSRKEEIWEACRPDIEHAVVVSADASTATADLLKIATDKGMVQDIEKGERYISQGSVSSSLSNGPKTGAPKSAWL